MSRSTPELLRETLVHLELASQFAGIDVLARVDPDTRARLFGTTGSSSGGCATALLMST